jgi:hypothetical protein
LSDLCRFAAAPFLNCFDGLLRSGGPDKGQSLVAQGSEDGCQSRPDSRTASCRLDKKVKIYNSSITHFCFKMLLACCLSLSAPAQAQQDQPGDEPAGNCPGIEALPEPSPQPKAAPLRGQVEQFTEFGPNDPHQNYSAAPYQQSPDPFAGLQPQTARQDYSAPAQPPTRPALPDLRGLLQTLMSMQGVPEQARSSAPPAVRPSWIPGYAYTNEYMVAPYHNLNVLWWDRQLMPRKPKWIKLSESVTKYWRGFVPDPCLVLITPLPEAPDNFSFQSPAQRGPSGWLQYTGEANRSGFPLYRYWFGRP